MYLCDKEADEAKTGAQQLTDTFLGAYRQQFILIFFAKMQNHLILD